MSVQSVKKSDPDFKELNPKGRVDSFRITKEDSIWNQPVLKRKKLNKIEGRYRYYLYYVVSTFCLIVLSASFKTSVYLIPRSLGIDITHIVLGVATMIGVAIATYEGFVNGTKEEE